MWCVCAVDRNRDRGRLGMVESVWLIQKGLSGSFLYLSLSQMCYVAVSLSLNIYLLIVLELACLSTVDYSA